MNTSIFHKDTDSQNVTPVLLTQFATEIDNLITEKGIAVLNYPGIEQCELDLKFIEQDAITGKHVYHVYTNKGSIFTTTPSAKQEKEPLTLATQEELTQYYRVMARAVEQTGRANCIGYAALALTIAEELTSNPKYQDIKVRVCSLQMWSHFFVQFVISDEETSLFYDPWFQRCNRASEASKPLTFTPQHFSRAIGYMLAELFDSRAILPIDVVQKYDPATKLLSSEPSYNCAETYSYEVVYQNTQPEKPALSALCTIS